MYLKNKVPIIEIYIFCLVSNEPFHEKSSIFTFRKKMHISCALSEKLIGISVFSTGIVYAFSSKI